LTDEDIVISSPCLLLRGCCCCCWGGGTTLLNGAAAGDDDDGPLVAARVPNEHLLPNPADPNIKTNTNPMGSPRC